MSDATPDLPHGLALAWGVAHEPTRGPKRELSVERIVAEAIAIADRDGLPAASMAAVAKACGVTTMALYRYLPGKDDLVLLMQEAVVGSPPDLTGLPWREALERWTRASSAALLAHPWTLDIPITGSPNTPRPLAWANAAMGALAPTSLPVSHGLAAVLALSAHARWHATLARRWHDGTSALESDNLGQVYPLIEAQFPHFAQAMADDQYNPDFDVFEYGMALVLDGLAARMG
ncbi:TetR/AcrR family transcriptional regulator [Demequina sp.]|uniref:TetR/AcrR family transcriptional regulator n=1 Tax=Demequina sp. TaxID=2050685 RepID=UPI003A887660